MSAKRTIQRANWLLTAEGDQLSIARSEHSDWITVTLADIPLLIADLREIAGAASPRRSMAELFAQLTQPDGEGER